jgi:Ras-related protein Rab-7L1
MKNIRSDLKIIIVGNAGTGKTSFVNKWTKNVFNENYKATIVSEFGYKIFEYQGKAYRIQVWDLAGQDKNTTMTKVFCKDSHGVVILSDITNSSSLDATVTWKKAIDDSVTFFDKSPLPMMLVQNKIDLVDPSEHSNNDLLDFSKRNGFVYAYQTSVRSNINVFESMNQFLSYLIDKTESMHSKNIEVRKSLVLSNDHKIPINGNKEEKKKCC